MSDRAKAIACVSYAVLVIGLLSGCRTTGPNSHAPLAIEPEATAITPGPTENATLPACLMVSIADRSAHDVMVRRDEDDPFVGHDELDLSQLNAEVIRRNRTLQAMSAAWRAAIQKGAQVVALDDPMLSFMLGPGTLGSNDVDFGWMVQGSQKIPWSGKRQLRGMIAQFQADAAFQDIAEARLKLFEAATLAFVEYYTAERELELNAQNVAKLQDILAAAYRNLEASKAGLGDVADIEVQIHLQNQRQMEWERAHRVAAARINALLHRPTDSVLPPAPKQLAELRALPPLQVLQKLAVERRPELAAEAARLRAEETEIALRCKEFYPDLEFVARYDGFWQGADRDLAPQLGLNLNLPLQKERRRAAVEEAVQNLARRRAEFDARLDEIQFEVQTAVERLELARASIERYAGSKGIIERAELSTESVLVGYEAAASDFLRLIESQRQLIGYRDKLVEYQAEYFRRLAELERAIGGPVTSDLHQ